MTLPRHSGPHELLDLRASIAELVEATPGITAVYLFGSRVHRTQSMRSDIDLLVFGAGLSGAKMNPVQWRISPYLDVFLVSGATAVSAANLSTIPAETPEDLLSITSAKKLWENGWVGPEHFGTQDVLRDYAPIHSVAIRGVEYLDVNAVDYLLVAALPGEYGAAIAAIGATKTGKNESLVPHHIGEVDTTNGKKTVAIVLLAAAGPVSAALTTSRLLDGMDVGLVVLIGITGAIKDGSARLGDVVVPNNIFDYEAAKVTVGAERLNPTIVPIPRNVYQRVRAFDFSKWSELAARDLPTVDGRTISPAVHLDRTMASGSKVLAESDRAALLQTTDRKTLAIEMESYGLAEACRFVEPSRDYLVVKAITDWANADKNDAWHEFASAASASLVVALIRSSTI
jgi:nucleoside phosphorylase/predicted nucleotidyltransferase